MGVLDYLSYLSLLIRSRKKKKHKQLVTLEFQVKLDCQGCQRRVKKSIESMKGVTSATIEPKFNRLTVVGHLDSEVVVAWIRKKTGKIAVPWPYARVSSVPCPYAPGVYDIKASPGYVRKVGADPDDLQQLASYSIETTQLTDAFHAENPHACTIM